MALFLDGKTFANDEIVVALAVTMGGDKVFAGFVQTETENARVITSFLRSLKDRGLDLSAGRDRRRQGAEVGSCSGARCLSRLETEEQKAMCGGSHGTLKERPCIDSACSRWLAVR